MIIMIIMLGLALTAAAAGAFGTKDIPGLQARAKEIIAKPSIFREAMLPRLPITSEQTEFLIDNPRVALALAHLYAPFLDKYQIELRPDHVVRIFQPGQLSGDALLIEARPGRRVYFITGYFDVSSIRFNGQMALATLYSEQRENNAISVDATTSASIRLTSSFAALFARLADLLFPKKVDERIDRFLRAAKCIAVEVHKDPGGAYEKLKKAGEVSVEELKEFGRIFPPEGS